jgi:hypothetical protein
LKFAVELEELPELLASISEHFLLRFPPVVQREIDFASEEKYFGGS